LKTPIRSSLRLAMRRSTASCPTFAVDTTGCQGPFMIQDVRLYEENETDDDYNFSIKLNF
jgi:hypothetical protein